MVVLASEFIYVDEEKLKWIIVYFIIRCNFYNPLGKKLLEYYR